MSHRPEVEKATGARGRTFGWSGGPGEVVVVVTTGMLVVRLDGRWRGWGWDEVLRGGWREKGSVLFWEVGGERPECVLDSPGELLSVFWGRVFASMMMTVNHDLPRGAVQTIVRRNLLDRDVTWLASASGGVSLEDPGMAAFVVAKTDRLRFEYGL